MKNVFSYTKWSELWKQCSIVNDVILILFVGDPVLLGMDQAISRYAVDSGYGIVAMVSSMIIAQKSCSYRLSRLCIYSSARVLFIGILANT